MPAEIGLGVGTVMGFLIGYKHYLKFPNAVKVYEAMIFYGIIFGSIFALLGAVINYFV